MTLHEADALSDAPLGTPKSAPFDRMLGQKLALSLSHLPVGEIVSSNRPIVSTQARFPTEANDSMTMRCCLSGTARSCTRQSAIAYSIVGLIMALYNLRQNFKLNPYTLHPIFLNSATRAFARCSNL